MIKDATHLSAIHALQRGRYLAELCLDRCYESCHHVLGALRLDFGRPVLRANKYRTGSEHPVKDAAWPWYKHKVKLPIVATTQGSRHLSTSKQSAAASMHEPSDWNAFLTHAHLRSPSIRSQTRSSGRVAPYRYRWQLQGPPASNLLFPMWYAIGFLFREARILFAFL